MEKKRNIRNSNIELLRIISMFFIVMGHFVGQTSYISYKLNINSFVIALLGNGSRVATNIFLLISVWFLYESKFSSERLVKMYLQLFFYSFVFTFIAVLMGTSSGMKDILRGCMPFFGRALWFVSAYISLYLLTPILKKFFLLNVRLQRVFGGISFVLVCLVSTLPDRQTGYLIDSIWFIFVFIWIGILRELDIIEKRKVEFCLFFGVSIYLLMVTVYFGGMLYDDRFWLGKARMLCEQYLYDIKTFPNFLCAFLLFWGVLSKKKKTNSLINKIASFSFPVYLVHQVPAFFPVLWTKIIRVELFKNLEFSAVMIFVVAIFIYLGAICVETLRKHMFEKRIEKLVIVQRAISYIDKLYEEVTYE